MERKRRITFFVRILSCIFKEQMRTGNTETPVCKKFITLFPRENRMRKFLCFRKQKKGYKPSRRKSLCLLQCMGMESLKYKPLQKTEQVT